MKLTTALLSVAASLALVAASPVFVECNDPGLLDGLLLGGLINGVVMTLGLGSVTNAACANACLNGGYKYSFYQPGILGVLLPNCKCADSKMSPATIQQSQDAAGGRCAGILNLGALYPQYTVTYTQTDLAAPVTLTGCFTGGSVSGGPSSTQFSDAATCIAYCKNWKYTKMTPHTSGMYTCECGYSQTLGSATRCGNNVALMYRATSADASGDALRRRRNAAQLALDADKDLACPRPLSSCLVQMATGDFSFECVDTTTELESCGGCVSGTWDMRGPAPLRSGVDCTTIEGVRFGAVSCINSECVASACYDGFDLADGKCVRNNKTIPSRIHRRLL